MGQRGSRPRSRTLRLNARPPMPSLVQTPLPVYLTEHIRRLEALADPAVGPPLMQRAGLAAAELALDVPSGLHSDSGRVLGQAVRAAHTMTFIALKPGLVTLDGPDYCGEVHVHDLGLDVEQLLAPEGYTLGSSILAQSLPRRPAN